MLELEQKRKKKGGADSLDVQFLIDCTSSMMSWIDKCKEEIKNIIKTIVD